MTSQIDLIRSVLVLVVVAELHHRSRNGVRNTKASPNASAFLFQTTFLQLGGYFVTNSKTRVSS